MTARRAREWLGHPAVGAVCRLLLGGVFIYTGLPKLLRPDEFSRLVNGYRILHPDMVNLAGIILPWVEVAAGGLLVIGILPQSNAAVIGGLLAVFMGAGFLALIRGLEIRCGCFFPIGGEQLTWVTLLRDAVMLALAVQILVWPSSFVPGERGR